MNNRGAFTKLTGCLVAVAAIAGFASLAHAHKGRSLCVNAGGGGSCFTTITAALKHSHSGDSIDIAAGTYVENIHIGKNSKKGEKIVLTIAGAGADSTIIDGGSAGTVVSIYPRADVTLSGVTVQNGSASGIAVRDGTLNLSNCAVTNSQGGPPDPAIGFSGGGIDFQVSNHPPKTAPQLNVDNCTISGNTSNGSSQALSCGGGIATNGGIANIINSTISGNTALGSASSPNQGTGFGGGICSGGKTAIANSTISGNQATGGEPWGGGIYYVGPLVLNNVTISNNSASTGIGKGGGIFSLSAIATASNTIIAGNSAHYGAQNDCGGNLSSQGHNLIDYDGCVTSGDTSSDIIGEDAMLGPLQLNAPGTTETQALMVRSAGSDSPDGCLRHRRVSNIYVAARL
jgi:hypothetical protein